MVLSIGNIAAAVAVVEVAKLLTEVSLSRATNRSTNQNAARNAGFGLVN